MKNNIIKKIIKKELIVLKKQKIATQTIVFSIFSLLLVIGMTLLMAFVLGSNKVTLDFEPDSKLKQ